MRKFFAFIAAVGIVLWGMNGCATKKYVDEQVELASAKGEGVTSQVSSVRSDMEENIGKVWKEIETNQKEVANLKDTVEKHKEEVKKELTAAQEAVSRAQGKIIKGKLLYEVTLSDESLFFDYKASELSKEATAALDMFAKDLIKENKDVYIEIQGHTDDIGNDSYNLKLGQARADAVKTYLYTKHKIPLQRMSVFSYGESKPVVANKDKASRSKNRRVVLMVMQ